MAPNIHFSYYFYHGSQHSLSYYFCHLIILGKELEVVNCKNTFEGVYQFSYEIDYGGGGICNSANSHVIACQEPGSQYVDNQIFQMNFAKCPDVGSSRNNSK